MFTRRWKPSIKIYITNEILGCVLYCYLQLVMAILHLCSAQTCYFQI